jgi:hypothetical protein
MTLRVSKSELSNGYAATRKLVTDGTSLAVLKPVANVLTQLTPIAVEIAELASALEALRLERVSQLFSEIGDRVFRGHHEMPQLNGGPGDCQCIAVIPNFSPPK